MAKIVQNSELVLERDDLFTPQSACPERYPNHDDLAATTRLPKRRPHRLPLRGKAMQTTPTPSRHRILPCAWARAPWLPAARPSRLSTQSALLAGLLLLTLALLAPSVVIGKDKKSRDGGPVEGVVVQVKNNEMIVDVGVKRGLPADATVYVYRRVEVVHPATGKTIGDRFPIGSVRLDQVGTLLSISNSPETLERTPAVGDFVVYEGIARRRTATPVDAASSTVVVTATAPVDPHREALDAAFQQTLGEPYSRRIYVWSTYLHENPTSPFVSAISRELEWLQHQNAAESSARSVMVQKGKPDVITARTAIPTEIFDDEPLELNASVVERELVKEVRLLVRHANDPGFKTINMNRDGDFNWRVTLDQQWKEPGTIELFIEVVRTNGTALPIAGNAASPQKVTIQPALRDAVDSSHRSRADMVFEWVDFDIGAKSGHRDAFIRFESQFRYVVDFKYLKAFTVGVGHFDGEGETVAALEQGDNARTRNITYGSAEVDLEFHPYVGVSGRVLMGNGHVSGQDTSQPMLGGGASVRIGELDGTRLIAGLSLTEQIGNEGWISFVLDEIPNIPITAGVVATNLPVGEDIGVSLQAGVGYRFNELFTASLRTGWNARTINHWGLTMGSGLSMTW